MATTFKEAVEQLVKGLTCDKILYEDAHDVLTTFFFAVSNFGKKGKIGDRTTVVLRSDTETLLLVTVDLILADLRLAAVDTKANTKAKQAYVDHAAAKLSMLLGIAKRYLHTFEESEGSNTDDHDCN